MAISQRLDLRQTQALVMTPQLQQAIKLLQLSHTDLLAHVDSELEQNPLLEMADDGSGTPPAEPSRTIDDAAATDAPSGSLIDRLERGELPADANGTGGDFDDAPETGAASPTMPSADAPWRERGAVPGDGDRGIAEPDRKTLHRHLQDQAAMAFVDPVERLIAAHLIDAVDDAGYLRADPVTMAAALGAPADRVAAVLAVIQGFDPAGVCARDLRECLELQLRERNRFDPAMAALLSRLDLVAKRDFDALRRICAVDAEDLGEMIAELRRLDPRPGLAFDGAIAHTVVPDLLMRAIPEGGWLVELNPETLPRIMVNEPYYATVSKRPMTRAERDYLAERFQAANWLVRSLHQRATTILKVATEIVRKQDGFFAHGVAELRPMILRDIAEAIGMHESTISRVTSNKFIATPWGTFELKYFFSAAIAGANGQMAHSAEAVRHRIKGLIDQEGANPLSDDQLVDLLRADGIEIARRTVAKYRESLHVPSSIQRRHAKVRA